MSDKKTEVKDTEKPIPEKKKSADKKKKSADKKKTEYKIDKKTNRKIPKKPAVKPLKKDPIIRPVKEEKLCIDAQKVSVFYGAKQALFDVDLPIQQNKVTALIGPSGCGKSTFLRCLNRMNDTIEQCNVTGQILFEDVDINDKSVDAVALRARIGMVFQKPNPFPKSIFDNVAYGPKIHGQAQGKHELEHIVEDSLKKASLWEEVKDRLDQPGTSLSGGQQQRLCIARTIAVNPEVILMDEPCSALDPIATVKIENLIEELKQNYTIVIVTHSMAQAHRVSQHTAFFHMGKIVEKGKTKQIFEEPQLKQTKDYISGRFG